jgi:hypothetical protein
MNQNFVLKVNCGDEFTITAKKAKEISISRELNVEFEFNGVKCLVDKATNTDLLYRDYYNAHTMDWKTVGPDCHQKYETEVQQELEKRERENALETEKKNQEYRLKEETARKSLKEKIQDHSIELKDSEGWNKSVEANSDPYGKASIDFARSWAILMQIEIEKGSTVAECAEKTSNEADVDGITGFMYGCAVSLLSQCWEYGEDLRKWHNKEYGHEGDGVVNPAIITINTEKK